MTKARGTTVGGSVRLCRLALALTTAVAATPAMAQQNRIDITVGALSGADSNILRTSPERAAIDDIVGGRLDVQDTFFVQPQVTVDISRRFGRQRAFVQGTLGYAFHDRNKFLDREDINLNGGLEMKIAGQCNLTPSASIYSTQSDAADLPADRANNVRILDYLAEFACPRPAGFYPRVSAQFTDTNNSARDERDQELWRGEIALGYAIPSFARLELYYGHVEVNRRERRDIDDNVTDPSTALDGVGLRMQRTIGTRVDIDARLEYQSIDAASARLREYEGLGASLSLKYTPVDRLTFTLSGDRGAKFNENSGSGYFIVTSARLASTFALSRRTRFGASARYADRDFVNEDGAFAVLGPRIRDREFIGSVEASHRLNRKIDLSLEGRYRVRNADNSLYDFESFRVTLGLSIALIRRGEI